MILALLAVSAHAYVPTAARLSPRPVALQRAAVACLPASSPAAVRVPASAVMAAGLVTETATRSAVKAVGWRITAGIVTAITSMIFTGSLAAAAAIVGWDLCSKSVTMFLGERLWNKVDWGKSEGADSSQRSLAKALAWRVFAATNTFVASTVLLKGKAGTAGKIAGSDTIFKTILFYFYERMWANISWGKEEVAEEAPAVEVIEA